MVRQVKELASELEDQCLIPGIHMMGVKSDPCELPSDHTIASTRAHYMHTHYTNVNFKYSKPQTKNCFKTVFAVRMLGNALQVNVSDLLQRAWCLSSRVSGQPLEPRLILFPSQHWD